MTSAGTRAVEGIPIVPAHVRPVRINICVFIVRELSTQIYTHAHTQVPKSREKTSRTIWRSTAGGLSKAGDRTYYGINVIVLTRRAFLYKNEKNALRTKLNLPSYDVRSRLLSETLTSNEYTVTRPRTSFMDVILTSGPITHASCFSYNTAGKRRSVSDFFLRCFSSAVPTQKLRIFRRSHRIIIIRS